MQWTENERDWLSKAAYANPRLRESVRKAITSDKFAISAIYRRFVINDLLNDDERAELCKMVWSRFRQNISGRDTIFAALLRAKLPESLYANFQRYMQKANVHLMRKRVGGAVAFATQSPIATGRRFRWWCALNSKLASENNVQFCDVKFTRAYCLVLDAYAQGAVDLDYVRKAFANLLSGDYGAITWMMREIGFEKRGTILSAWLLDGKVIRFSRGLYQVHRESYKAALRNDDEISFSPQGH